MHKLVFYCMVKVLLLLEYVIMSTIVDSSNKSAIFMILTNENKEFYLRSRMYRTFQQVQTCNRSDHAVLIGYR